MLRVTATALVALTAAVPLSYLPRPQAALSGASPRLDTIQAGDARVDVGRLHPFALERRLTLTRGDTARPFGRQSESLAAGTLDGRRVLLGVLTFDTPRATTVDSSWLDAATLRPIRMRSSNADRVVALEFNDARVRQSTMPSQGSPSMTERSLAVRPFEWNMFGLALSALPLRPGFRAAMPVYSDRFERVVWYRVEVLRDTTLVRANGHRSPMWEVLASPDSAAPTVRFWVSQRHRFVDQMDVSEPVVAIRYERGL